LIAAVGALDQGVPDASFGLGQAVKYQNSMKPRFDELANCAYFRPTRFRHGFAERWANKVAAYWQLRKTRGLRRVT
jgi:hypothetical protein